MRYIIEKLDRKSVNVGGAPKQLIEGVFRGEDGVNIEASIWRDQKDGTAFPDFDTLQVHGQIEANPWTNPNSGKVSLYPPKQASKGSFGGSKGNSAAISRAMEQKDKNIKKNAETKDVNIRLAAAMRDAVQLAICELSDPTANKSALATRILHWRSWLISNHGDERDIIDPTK